MGLIPEGGGGDAVVPPRTFVGWIELDGAAVVFEGLLPVGGGLSLETEVEVRGAPGGVGFDVFFVEAKGAVAIA